MEAGFGAQEQRGDDQDRVRHLQKTEDCLGGLLLLGRVRLDLLF